MGVTYPPPGFLASDFSPFNKIFFTLFSSFPETAVNRYKFYDTPFNIAIYFTVSERFTLKRQDLPKSLPRYPHRGICMLMTIY